jgi:ribonuclease Z
MGNEGHTEPLLICGPKGVDEIVKALTIIAPELPFRIKTQVLSDFSTLERHGFSITAFEVNHSSACLGYDIRLNRPGKFDREKAEKNGVPITFEQIYALITTLRDFNRSHADWKFVEVQSAGGEYICVQI